MDRVEQPVRRRQLPEPGQHADAPEAEFFDAAPDFGDRLHGPGDVDRTDADQAVRIFADEPRDLVVRDHDVLRRDPGRDQRLRDPGRVHRADRRRHRNLLRRRLLAAPAPERVEDRITRMPQGGVLCPGVNDHGPAPQLHSGMLSLYHGCSKAVADRPAVHRAEESAADCGRPSGGCNRRHGCPVRACGVRGHARTDRRPKPHRRTWIPLYRLS